MDIYMYTIVSVSDLNVALTLVFKQEEQCNTKCALTLWAFGQCPVAYHFRGPTRTILANLKRAKNCRENCFCPGT